MIGTSRIELYFIRFCIFGLHYLAPLCILYCILVIGLYGFQAAKSPLALVIEVWAVAEALFFIFGYLPYRRYLQHDAKHPPPLDTTERKELFHLCNDNIPDLESYLKKWCLGAPPEEIKRENVKDFFLWAFFNRSGPPGDDDEELEEYIAATEKHLGRKIEPGKGDAQCLRLTLDKVDMLHRSLLWYSCVGLVDFLTGVSLLYHGFEFHRNAMKRFFRLFPLRPLTLVTTQKSPVKYTTYWYRPHTSKTRLPILFIHGIGIGLYPYVKFLNELNSTDGLESNNPDDQIGIIAIEIMSVSFRITDPALSKDALCTEVRSILQHHGWDKVVLVSHSYGTVISTHLLKSPSTAAMIGPIMLIDPVSILLHLPDVAYNFTRRKPQKANEYLLYYFASMDLGVSHTLSRHFFWSENVLWKKDLSGRNMTVCLSGKDLIVNTEAVGSYLASKDDHRELAPSASQSSGSLIDILPLETPSSATDADDAPLNTLDGQDLDAWKHRPWTGKGIDIFWFENIDHAQIFDKEARRRPLINALRQYCKQGR